MSRNDDRVTVEQAYAEALLEIGRLSERLIVSAALIKSLRDGGGECGAESAGAGGYAGGDDSTDDISP